MDGNAEFELEDIGNYYGGLTVRRDAEGKCWWEIYGLESCGLQPIPESLYVELLRHYVSGSDNE